MSWCWPSGLIFSSKWYILSIHSLKSLWFLGNAFWITAIVTSSTPLLWFPSVQFSSVQLCPTLCDPMNHSTPGHPVHHKLPEFTQTHIHRVGDAIQPSHPLSSLSPPAHNPPSIRVFSNESTLHMRWPKYWTFRFSMLNPRADLLQNGLVGSPCSPRDSQESYPTPQFKSINSALSFLHSPTLTSIHGHRKNHSLD